MMKRDASVERSFEEKLAAVDAARMDNLSALVTAGAIPATDIRRFHKSDDDVVVGTVFESNERQRGGIRFTRPTSRSALIRDLKS